MFNRNEAEAYLRKLIATEPRLYDHIDLDTLTEELHQIASGTWDFQHIDSDVLWATVRKHYQP